jgi:hypothetical protein
MVRNGYGAKYIWYEIAILWYEMVGYGAKFIWYEIAILWYEMAMVQNGYGTK